MSDESPQIIETTEELVEILQQTRNQLRAAQEELRVSNANELFLWRLIGKQILVEQETDE